MRSGGVFSLGEVAYLLVAAVIGLLLLGILNFFQEDEVTFMGTHDVVTGSIAGVLRQCWTDSAKTRSESRRCDDYYLNATAPVYEYEVAERLEGGILSDNKCVDGDCSEYGDDDQVDWRVDCNDCRVVVSYDAGSRMILVRSVEE